MVEAASSSQSQDLAFLVERHSTENFSTFYIIVQSRVARWFIFKAKIPIWVNFGGPYVDWKMFIYFMDIWNILWTFGIFYGHL
jgi:hypothetical protein